MKEEDIPQGPYCYTLTDDGYFVCPYWSIREDKPEQENGYCAFLKKGDWELYKDTEFTDLKTGEVTKGEDMPFSPGLLWDQCKECGVNDKFDEDED